MEAKSVQVTAAIARHLNEGSFVLNVTATASLVPQFDREDMSSLRVTIVPSAVSTERLTRDSAGDVFTIDVAIQKSTSGDKETRLLLLLSEQIKESIERFESSKFVWLATKTNVLFSFEHLQDLDQFTNVTSYDFQYMRVC